MDTYQQLSRHGLFDAKVPRYTSYPPANHFQPQAGREHQAEWLSSVAEGAEVSLYLHIPFCKRLCWFCACRTQGTKSMRPVETYIDTLIREVEMVRARLPRAISMSRLHLGGGTPTILPAGTMARLLDKVFEVFEVAGAFEFSVEIDPTEASDDLLQTLIDRGMNRASIGVQDFDPQVQAAIGRLQTFDQTHRVITTLRAAGLTSLNMDLLYGLPHQTGASLSDTLQKVLALQPDRLALYGYAHVPWMSKRQVMIDEAALPSPEKRFSLTELARRQLVADGFQEIGIDHFARPGDGLALARDTGRLRRNFQGYTDDPAETLIGLGASAISRFAQGYVQNASATSIYQGYLQNGELAGLRGYQMEGADALVARMIELLMCDFEISTEQMVQEFPDQTSLVLPILQRLRERFSDVVRFDGSLLRLEEAARPLVRVIAASIDQFQADKIAHSAAV